MRLTARGTAAAVAVLLCAGCPSPAPERERDDVSVASEVATATADATLRWAVAEPGAIIPQDATTATDLLIVDALFDSLTAWDAGLAVVPAAAVSWSSDDDFRRWRFELRDGATFHDGSPVTATSFVTAWNDMARQGAAHHHLRDVTGYSAVRAGRSDTLSGVRAESDEVLEVRLSRPVADFPTMAGHPALGPAAGPVEGVVSDEPVGNGPFRMAEPWAVGRFVRLQRVVAASGDARLPGRRVDEVVFRFQDQASRTIAFDQGRVDVADVPAAAVAGSVRPRARRIRRGATGVLDGQLPTTYFLWFDTRRAPFDDIAVRRAVSMALDRGSLIRQAFDGAASVAWSVVPSPLAGGRLRTCQSCGHDPDAARATLRRAGVRRLPLWISEDGEHERVAERLRLDLAAVGVQVEVRALPFDEFVVALRDGVPGMFRFGWTLDYPVAENALRPLFHSSSGPEVGGVNYGRYGDAAVDELLDQASRTTSVAEREGLLGRAERLVVGRDQAIIPLVAPRRTIAIAPRVRGLTYGPFGTSDLAGIRLLDRPSDR